MANPKPPTTPEAPAPAAPQDTLTAAPSSSEMAELQAKLAAAQAEVKALKESPPAPPSVPMTRWLIQGGAFHSANTGLLVPGSEVLLPSTTPGPPGWKNMDTGETIPEVPLFTPVASAAPVAVASTPARAPAVPVAVGGKSSARASDSSPVK